MAQDDPPNGAIREGEPPYRGPTVPATLPRSRRKRWIFLTVGLIAFAVVTAGKHFLNEIDLAFYNAYNSPEARFLADAESKNLLVSRFKIDPIKLVREDKTYEFKEAWLEAAYEPCHTFVWFSFQ